MTPPQTAVLAGPDAADLFSALAHETRLTVFRTVMRAGPGGVSAGELAQRAGVSPSNLSAHLSLLLGAGLLQVRREGRHRYYSPDLSAIGGLVDYLVMECCDGRPEICRLLPRAAC